MKLWEVALIGVGLSMDAFAVALCRGLEMKKFNLKHAVIIAVFFGFFQAVMPLIGWIAGAQFSKYIESVDHWIAFGLLGFLGLKSVVDSLKKDEISGANDETLNIKRLFVMAVATSIDALAVGVTFSFVKFERASYVVYSAVLIGVITFLLSLTGVYCGNKIGIKLKRKAEFLGGIILILIGIKILLEHLGILPF
ncbi:MAG: manganese efflux pump [Clostridia bacterium]|nr:manganese efflux pump [Clostridia bacterium]